jgi:hypothetical protein
VAVEAAAWRALDGHTTVTIGAVTWLAEGTPWAVFKAEEVLDDVHMQEYIQTRGP